MSPRFLATIAFSFPLITWSHSIYQIDIKADTGRLDDLTTYSITFPCHADRSQNPPTCSSNADQLPTNLMKQPVTSHLLQFVTLCPQPNQYEFSSLNGCHKTPIDKEAFKSLINQKDLLKPGAVIFTEKGHHKDSYVFQSIDIISKNCIILGIENNITVPIHDTQMIITNEPKSVQAIQDFNLTNPKETLS